MKTKLSNDMKSYLECIEEAAVRAGDISLSTEIVLSLDETLLELLDTAADIYASQSNSHKPVIGGPASASVSEGEQLGNEAVDTVAAGWFCNQEEQVGKGYRCGKQCDLCKEAERKSSEEQP